MNVFNQKKEISFFSQHTDSLLVNLNVYLLFLSGNYKVQTNIFYFLMVHLLRKHKQQLVYMHVC